MFREEKGLEVRPATIHRGFLSERKGKVIPCREAEDGKSAGTNSENAVM